MSQESSTSSANTPDEVELAGINTIRALALDAVHKAKSGHQGTAMALAPLAHVLFTRVMNYDPSAPAWPNRDRFVMSGGHVSILQYSMLYLTGYGLELSDLVEFRQWGSATPGHPEVGHTAGVEVTTGPLGQGFANAVGMAAAERYLRATFGSDVCDHDVYVTVGDGDLSEGVSHEAASLAGHLGLGHLIAIYDDNHVTIDGPTELALTDDAPARFRSYGWEVLEVGEIANDLDALTASLQAARKSEQPTLIVLRSEIGYPSPNLTNHFSAHGNPFDDEEIAATKAVMGMDPDETFAVSDDVLAFYRAAGAKGAETRRAWEQTLVSDPNADLWDLHMNTERQGELARQLEVSFEAGANMATRKASQACLAELEKLLPSLYGGSADLTGNTGTKLDSSQQSTVTPAGRQVYFGVREHAMGSLLVGAAHHGGVIPFGGTFLVFADYMRPAVRLAAMSKANCVFVWTHDSVGVGQDGPTHQPVEQLMSLRAIPGLTVVRPADANEVVGAWCLAMQTEGPTALILSRQDTPVLENTTRDGVLQGAYRLSEAADAQVTLIGTGTEVAVCLAASEQLAAEGIASNVVSMPSWEAFEQRSAAERASVIDSSLPSVSVEAGVTLGWHKYATEAVGIDRFGQSAPGGLVLERLGINPDAVAATVRTVLAAK